MKTDEIKQALLENFYAESDCDFFYINRETGCSDFECKEEFSSFISKKGLQETEYSCVLFSIADRENSFEEILGEIETDLRIPKSKVERIKFAQNPDCDFDVFKVSSKFWFDNLINFEFLCCIFKTCKYGRRYTEKLGYRDFLKSYSEDYFREEGMLWALKNIKKLREIIGVKPGGEAKAVHSLTSNGVVSMMGDYLDGLETSGSRLDRKQYDAILAYEDSI